MSLIMTIGGIILSSYTKIRFFHIRTSDKFFFIAKHIKKHLLAASYFIHDQIETFTYQQLESYNYS